MTSACASGVLLALYSSSIRHFVAAKGDLGRADSRMSVDNFRDFGQQYPRWLTEPPLSPVAILFIGVALFTLIFTFGIALESFHACDHMESAWKSEKSLMPGGNLWWANLFFAIHGFSLLNYSNERFGRWAMMSFTVTSWNLLTIRSLLSILAPWSEIALVTAEFLRFPVLLFNSVTFIVYWTAIFPIAIYVLRGKERRGFIKFQLNFGLINLHILNFPMACAQAFLMSSRRNLEAFDLHAGFASAIIYLCFYLYALERQGTHLYIILSPRTPLCGFVYASMMALFGGIWFFANELNTLSSISW